VSVPVGDGGFLAQLVEPAVDVGVGVSVVVGDGVDDRFRRLARRGVVQVDELLAAELPLEDGEVLAYPLDVQRLRL